MLWNSESIFLCLPRDYEIGRSPPEVMHSQTLPSGMDRFSSTLVAVGHRVPRRRNYTHRGGYQVPWCSQGVQVIASWHDWSGDLKWDGGMVKEKYELSNRSGDIVKIVGESLENQGKLCVVSSNPGAKPIIAVNMGVEG